MIEKKTTGSPEGDVENYEPISLTGKEVTGEPITKTVYYGNNATEPALRQSVDAEINSLRTHFEDSLKMISDKVNNVENLFKSKQENIEIKLNYRIDLLEKDVQGISGKKKVKKDKHWDIIILIISIIITIILTLMADKILYPLVKDYYNTNFYNN